MIHVLPARTPIHPPHTTRVRTGTRPLPCPPPPPKPTLMSAEGLQVCVRVRFGAAQEPVLGAGV